MTVAELTEALEKYDPDMEVAILDGFNGGGVPRQINFGPRLENYNQANHDQTYREDLIDDEADAWIIIGYGCY